MLAIQYYQQFNSLPEALQAEVLQFIDFLLFKNNLQAPKPPPPPVLKFDWAGGLEELKKDYTSVELQHKILEYW